MAKCNFCEKTGSNMKTCDACCKIWCATCLNSGKWPVKRPRSANICPYCGAMGKVKLAK